MKCKCGKTCNEVIVFSSLPGLGEKGKRRYFVTVTNTCPDYIGFPNGTTNGHLGQGEQRPIDEKKIPKGAKIIRQAA